LCRSKHTLSNARTPGNDLLKSRTDSNVFTATPNVTQGHDDDA
jgi:hypothetical protein